MATDKRKMGNVCLTRRKCRLQMFNRASFSMIIVKRMHRSEFLPIEIPYGTRQNNGPLGKTKLQDLR